MLRPHSTFPESRVAWEFFFTSLPSSMDYTEGIHKEKKSTTHNFFVSAFKIRFIIIRNCLGTFTGLDRGRTAGHRLKPGAYMVMFETKSGQILQIKDVGGGQRCSLVR